MVNWIRLCMSNKNLNLILISRVSIGSRYQLEQLICSQSSVIGFYLEPPGGSSNSKTFSREDMLHIARRMWSFNHLTAIFEWNINLFKLYWTQSNYSCLWAFMTLMALSSPAFINSLIVSGEKSAFSKIWGYISSREI